MSLFSEKLANCEARINAVEIELVDFMETRPTSSAQWTEERLRALEDQVKTLKERDTQTRMMIVDLLKEVTELQEKQLPEKYNELDSVLTQQACEELAKANDLPLKNPDLSLAHDVQLLKDWFRDAKQIHDADLKRVGKDMKMLYTKINQLTERVKELEFSND